MRSFRRADASGKTPPGYTAPIDDCCRDEDRRARQRRHFELAGGDCDCSQCRRDGPMVFGEVIDEVLAKLGIVETDQGMAIYVGGPGAATPGPQVREATVIS